MIDGTPQVVAVHADQDFVPAVDFETVASRCNGGSRRLQISEIHRSLEEVRSIVEEQRIGGFEGFGRETVQAVGGVADGSRGAAHVDNYAPRGLHRVA